jgi:hypothetical protein
VHIVRWRAFECSIELANFAANARAGMGNGTLPHGPSYRAYPRLCHQMNPKTSPIGLEAVTDVLDGANLDRAMTGSSPVVWPDVDRGQ